jgi:hypothetical protein
VLLDRGEFLKPRGLSLGISERVSALSSALFAVALFAAVALQSATFAIVAAIALAAFILANAGLFNRLRKLRGFPFSTLAVPLHIVYNITAVSALLWTLVTHRVTPIERAHYRRRQ